jgi:glycosyltransferase involved in cell wall biosynthesis
MIREILIVSKPLSPPWNDSGKVCARDLVDALPERRFRVLVPRGRPYPARHVASEEIYDDPGRFRPSLGQNLRVMGHLLRGDAAVGLWHFFFAPNPRTSLAARLACRLRRKPTVQTVLSAPASFKGVGRLCFGDRVVVLSDFARERLAQEGVPGAVRIYPAVPPAEPASPERQSAARARLGLAGEPIVLYPGDLEFSRAARTVVEAAPEILRGAPGARVIVAARPKTRAAVGVEAELRALAQGEPRVIFAGELPDMRALVAASTVVVFPAERIFAKTDLPIVLLEALAEGVPLVVGDRPPLVEILQDEVGVGVTPGVPEALAEATLSLLQDQERRLAMGRRARALAAGPFGAPTMAAAYDCVYRELLD